ncbi:MAG TPA: hypothetical protein VK528_05225 [Flavobacterium sp.]|nr:hypothetical protein [Flavobacterium sp.]
MKRKFAILNISLIVAILSSILFQSIHSFEHLVAEFTQEKCEHPHDTGKSQITHQHHNFDHCFTCEFHFSNFVTPQTYFFSVFSAYRAIPYFFTISETPASFSGSSYALRGPPALIV